MPTFISWPALATRSVSKYRRRFVHTYIHTVHTYIHYLNSPLITHTHDLGHPRGASAVTGCGEPGQHSRPSGHHRENGRGKTQTESAETDPGCPERGVMPHTYIHTYTHTWIITH